LVAPNTRPPLTSASERSTLSRRRSTSTDRRTERRGFAEQEAEHALHSDEHAVGLGHRADDLVDDFGVEVGRLAASDGRQLGAARHVARDAPVTDGKLERRREHHVGLSDAARGQSLAAHPGDPLVDVFGPDRCDRHLAERRHDARIQQLR
jgi:hypothetical protein